MALKGMTTEGFWVEQALFYDFTKCYEKDSVLWIIKCTCYVNRTFFYYVTE